MGLALPHQLVRDLALAPGDEVLVQLERLPGLLAMAGRLRGKITADEFTDLSNEGEDLG